MFLKKISALVSPAGVNARLTVLIFHRVLPAADPVFPDEVDAARFDRILGWLKSAFMVLPLSEGVDKLRNAELPANALAITFDDGYRDNLTIATPLLQKHGLPATVFVSTAFLDGGAMFNDVVSESVKQFSGSQLDLDDLGLGVHATDSLLARRTTIESLLKAIKYLPTDERMKLAKSISVKALFKQSVDLMLSSDELMLLRKSGIEIGGHTHSHPILCSLPPDEAKRDIQFGKNQLESIIDETVSLFAYPNGKLGGDFVQQHADMVRDVGYKAAFTTESGSAGPESDFFQLPRFTPWDRSAVGFCGRIMFGKMRDKSRSRHLIMSLSQLGSPGEPVHEQ